MAQDIYLSEGKLVGPEGHVDISALAGNGTSPLPDAGLRFPATASNYAACADSAALDVTGDAEWEFDMIAQDWTPDASQFTPFYRDAGADPNRAWFLRVNGDGTIRLTWYPDGLAASLKQALSTPALPVADGERIKVKVTLDVDNGAGGWDVNFYTRTSDEDAWTQLGATVTGAGATALPAVTAALQVGQTGVGGGLTNGTIFYFAFRNGIGGTIAAELDNRPGGWASRYIDAADNTWTMTGSAWGWTVDPT